MRIGLFGGSFDPVHSGHVGIARRAISDLALDRLVVLPAAVNPFKAGAPQGFSPARRLALARIAFTGVAKVAVDGRELARGGVSYAIDTVREFAAENPGAELFYIVGEDSLAGLPRWKDADELLKLCTFKAYPRTVESSSEIRRRLESGEGIGTLVPESVELFLRHGVVCNPDGATADLVYGGVLRKDGFCPCRLPKTDEFACPCAEFKSQLADSAFSGLCHCRLYLKPEGKESEK